MSSILPVLEPVSTQSLEDRAVSGYSQVPLSLVALGYIEAKPFEVAAVPVGMPTPEFDPSEGCYIDFDDPIYNKDKKAQKKAKHRKRARDLGLDPTTTLKTCTRCEETKPLNLFSKHDTSGDGYTSHCNACRDAHHKKKRDSDPAFRLKHHIATRVATQFPRDQLPKRFTANLEQYLGYSMVSLVEHLEKRVKETYDINLVQAFVQDYHLDHIRPLSSFICAKIGDQEFQRCWHPMNLKMIPAAVNLKKGSKKITSYKEVGHHD